MTSRQCQLICVFYSINWPFICLFIYKTLTGLHLQSIFLFFDIKLWIRTELFSDIWLDYICNHFFSYLTLNNVSPWNIFRHLTGLHIQSFFLLLFPLLNKKFFLENFQTFDKFIIIISLIFILWSFNYILLIYFEPNDKVNFQCLVNI